MTHKYFQVTRMVLVFFGMSPSICAQTTASPNNSMIKLNSYHLLFDAEKPKTKPEYVHQIELPDDVSDTPLLLKKDGADMKTPVENSGDKESSSLDQ